MKAYVEAYGCTLNFGESREIEEMLASAGWEIASSPDGADLVVLATCVVIDTTERAMLRRLKELSGAPRLVVTGCMATACREKAERVVPHAEFVSPGDLDGFAARLGIGPLASPREFRADSYAIVPIATGCRGNCAYCITRLARGVLRSRPQAQIIKAIEAAASSGPREIQLTAQDTASYGVDLGSSLPELVARACSVQLDFRLRVGMMNPKSVLAVLEGIAKMYLEPKVFKFLHLPVQSGSDRLLESMDRGYTVSDFERIVRVVRERVPNLTLSTDLIVGYPGEDESDHLASLDLIRRTRPDIVNVTRFSPRPGTRAVDSGPKVVGWKAKERSREVTELRFEIALEKNQSMVGRTYRALATERGKNKSTILRTDEYKQIVVRENLVLNKYYELQVKEATPTHLVAERVGS